MLRVELSDDVEGLVASGGAHAGVMMKASASQRGGL